MKKPLRKRTLALVLACAAALALMVPALACGGHGRHHGRQGQSQVTVCGVQDCEARGRHIHDGVTYCGYAHESGICDGRCLALCGVGGCTTAGRHIHSGVAYCGNHHEAGFCTGACASAAGTAGYHHRGHHHG